jgi:hypothetical protein
VLPTERVRAAGARVRPDHSDAEGAEEEPQSRTGIRDHAEARQVSVVAISSQTMDEWGFSHHFCVWGVSQELGKEEKILTGTFHDGDSE